MSVNVPGLIAILIFYVLIAVVGVLAARFTRRRKSASASETIMVGARDIGLFLGISTMSGGTLEVVAGLPRVPSVVVSTAISVIYTILGGLYSVAYTDLLQLGMILFGLVLASPFTLTNEAVGSIIDTAKGGWLGTLNSNSTGTYIDLWFLVLFGGIPLQVVYQRVFSADTTKNAQIMLICGGLCTVAMTIPSILLGAAGASTNWTMTTFMNGSGTSPADLGYQRLILPIALQYLTPPVVAFFGLGAVCAAVMSSTDSTFLASGSLFGRNIYKKLIRPQASEREIVIVIRVAIVLVGVISAAVSLLANSISAFLYLCADVSFATCFPLFASVLYLDPNIYGAIPAIIIALVLRIGGGDSLLNWDPPFPYVGGANFPVRTVAAVSSFITLTVFSYLVKILFEKGYMPEKYDFLKSNLARGGRTRYLSAIKKPQPESSELPEIYANKSVEPDPSQTQ